MSTDLVSLLIKEPGAEKARYVEVDHVPFTIGNTKNADVIIHRADERVRTRIARFKDGYRALNLVDSIPGHAVRTLHLKNKTKLKTGGVHIQFFTTVMSDELVELRTGRLEESLRSGEAAAHLDRMPVTPAAKKRTEVWDDLDRMREEPKMDEAALDELMAANQDEIFVIVDPEVEKQLMAAERPQAEADLDAGSRRRLEINRFRARPSTQGSKRISRSQNLRDQDQRPKPATGCDAKGVREESRLIKGTENLLDRARILLKRLDRLSLKIDSLPESIRQKQAAS